VVGRVAAGGDEGGSQRQRKCRNCKTIHAIVPYSILVNPSPVIVDATKGFGIMESALSGVKIS
jgi:hypothetical protein